MTMNDVKTPGEIGLMIAGNLRRRRKEAGLSQQRLAEKADVSLGSLKRFEQTGEISLFSLSKLAIVLDCAEDFGLLFGKKEIRSIQEIIDGKV